MSIILDRHLKDKVALITGAAQRIGAMTARMLHAAGANLILHYRSSRQEALELQKELHESRPDSVLLVQAELLDMANLSTLAKQAQLQWGRLDILVNSASGFSPTPVGNVAEDRWGALMGGNLKGPLF